MDAARRMQIAHALEAMRRRKGLKQEDIAHGARLSSATVSRILDWKSTVNTKPSTIAIVARAAGGTEAEIQTLVQLAADATAGWWVGDDAVPTWLHPLVSLEENAKVEKEIGLAAIPGLCQTRDYAVAIHRAQDFGDMPEEIDRQVDARMKRQTVLDRDPPFRLQVVLDEAVLHRLVGGAKVMAGQIDHLRDIAQRPNIDLQVLPAAAGAHASIGQFVMLDVADTTVVYVEMLGGGVYLDKRPDVERYSVAWDRVRHQAADASVSLEILSAVSEEYRR